MAFLTRWPCVLRKKAKLQGQFKGMVRGAKKGALLGKKMQKAKRKAWDMQYYCICMDSLYWLQGDSSSDSLIDSHALWLFSGNLSSWWDYWLQLSILTSSVHAVEVNLHESSPHPQPNKTSVHFEDCKVWITQNGFVWCIVFMCLANMGLKINTTKTCHALDCFLVANFILCLGS